MRLTGKPKASSVQSSADEVQTVYNGKTASRIQRAPIWKFMTDKYTAKDEKKCVKCKICEMELVACNTTNLSKYPNVMNMRLRPSAVRCYLSLLIFFAFMVLTHLFCDRVQQIMSSRRTRTST